MSFDAADTGTIFDSPWFAAERPFFKKIEKASLPTLDALLIIFGLALIVLAFCKGHAVFKAVVVGWIVLP